MSTLKNLEEIHYFRLRKEANPTLAKILAMLPVIVVIAFTVKSAFALEGKSDNIRQQEIRQQKIIDKIRDDLKIGNNVKDEVIYPDTKEGMGLDEYYLALSKALKEWKKRNEGKKVLYVLDVGPLFFPEFNQDDSLSYENPFFKPLCGIVFFFDIPDKVSEDTESKRSFGFKQ